MSNKTLKAILPKRTPRSTPALTKTTPVKPASMQSPRFATLADLPESVLLLIASYNPRTITISHDPKLASEFKIYSEAHIMPPLLQLNRKLRTKAQKLYRLSFNALLNNRPLYFNFSLDTILISSIEAFAQFLVPIGYTAGTEQELARERHYLDCELRYLAFDTPLYYLCMQTLSRFRNLREVVYVEWPEVGVKTRAKRKAPRESCELLGATMELWERAAELRKQVGFKLPDMLQRGKEQFEALFRMDGEVDSEYALWLQGKVQTGQSQSKKSRDGKGAVVSKL